ncbi:unnamed protein product, partial [Scytosiphon promiscuus]
MAASYDEIFASATGLQVKHRTEFRSESDEALRLTVRQGVRSKVGLKQLGRSVLVFDFEPAADITASNSPSTSQRSAKGTLDGAGTDSSVVNVEAAA